jgi:predicted small metal-binding protein
MPGRRARGSAETLESDYHLRQDTDRKGLMKQFKCGDVVPGCQWVACNEDEDELFQEIGSHARETHGMDEVPPEVVEAIHGVITEV